ncbi:MAG TPA: tetratricopeptide repeat protein [Pirellulales bacterium]|nr:tetratricopeptide repeat protein [Pirellulales bacterium]
MLSVAGCGQSEKLKPREQAAVDFDAGRWEAVIADCTQAIAETPDDADAYLLRGRAQQLAGHLNEAVDDFTTAIRLNPRDPEPHYQRANAYQALGKTDLKDEDNMAARRLDPEYSYLHKADDTPAIDPAQVIAEIEAESADLGGTPKKSPPAQPDVSFAPPTTTPEPPKRSFVEEMFGVPLSPSEIERGATSGAGQTDWPLPGANSSGEAPPRAATSRQAPGTGGAIESRNRDVAGRAPDAAAARELPPQDRAGQGGSRSQPNPSDYRSLHPFGPSGMRSTGTRDSSTYGFDPRTGYPIGKGHAATVGGMPYQAPSPYATNPYAPAGQASGAWGARPATPPARSPFAPLPPGNRYDGDR